MIRTILYFAALAALASVAWTSEAPEAAQQSTTKKTTAKKTTGSRMTAGTRTTGQTTARTSAGSRTARKPVTRTSWRNRQMAPSPERYKEIQEALVSKGYLKPEDASGKWDDTSAEAMKRFQTDQNLDSTGKINSLSLIALGLGPKHDTAAAPKPTVPPAQ